MNAPVEGAQALSPEGAETQVTTETKRPERVVVRPAADSRLEGLHAQYEVLKQAEVDAKQAFSSLKNAIAAELEALYAGDDRPSDAYEVPASIYGPALTIYYKSQVYLPSDPIKQFFPEIYNQFKQQKVFTEVRASQAGQSRGGRRK